MKINQIHGITSLCLVLLSSVIGLGSILNASLSMGLVYIVILMLAPVVIVYAYCTKCPCRFGACAHVLPGKLAQFFPSRTPGPYTLLDVAGVLVAVLAMLMFPQFWLWQHKMWFVLSWVLQVVAVIEIRLFVCRRCENRYCMLSRKPQK